MINIRILAKIYTKFQLTLILKFDKFKPKYGIYFVFAKILIFFFLDLSIALNSHTSGNAIHRPAAESRT